MFDGTKWVAYSGQSVNLDAGGRLLVRTTVVNDAVYEGAETFSLTARNAASQAASGIATVHDDGTGDIYKTDGSLDLIQTRDDDRPLLVSSPTVNEASPYAIFTVSGKAGQATTLALTDGTAGSADYGPGLEVFNGTTWVPYTGQIVFLDADGRLLVRTPVVNDGVYEGVETFNLIARNMGGQQAVGVASVRDDGKGDIWTSNGVLDTDRVKDDDRVLSVSSLTVNEASPFAFFTVSGQSGQVLTLKLSPGTAQSADYGPSIEVFNGVTWELYTGQLLQLDADGRLLVRTPLVNDGVFEGPETFGLVATKVDGKSASGVATIQDDGTGDVYTREGRVDASAVKDDDRRAPPVIVVPETAVYVPVSPERWMPHVGDVEFRRREPVEPSDGQNGHTPLRFDSALFPLLNLDSVKDRGLTEPVEQDASQRLKSDGLVAVVQQAAVPASDAGEARSTARLDAGSNKLGEQPSNPSGASADSVNFMQEFKLQARAKPVAPKAALPGRQAFSEKLKLAASAKTAERRSI